MSNLVDYAKRELEMISPTGEDEMQDEMARHIISIVEMFAKEGHSGSSGSYAVACLEKLLRFEPLKPLTGEDDEWVEVGDGVFQNKRCSRVFKEGDVAYDIEGKVFVDPQGLAFTSRDSRVNITFPYRPTTERIQVPA